MNYPNNIKKDTHKINYGNRGMGLEHDLNDTNNYYLQNNIAVIHKKPTPITIVSVDYKSRQDAVIKEAYFKTPSTTDYNGVYKGKYIDFEAKETKNKQGFPLINIHKHQLEHLKSVVNAGGIAFLIIRFTTFNETYLISADNFLNYIDIEKKKNIPIKFFKDKGHILKEKYNPRLDYLSIIDKFYLRGESLWKIKLWNILIKSNNYL